MSLKIAVLDWSTLAYDNDISPEGIKALGDVRFFPLTKPEDTVKSIGDAEAVLCNKVLITRDVIDACPNLRYIGLFATGYNNVDVKYAAEKGITVCNAGQYSTNAVAQQTFAYILDHFSRIREYDSLVKKGEWERSAVFSCFPLRISELAGKTIAIVGFGSIGKRVAELASAFGMNVTVTTRTYPDNCPYEVTDIGSAAKKADILTLHCPLTEQTRGIANASLFGLMKPSAVLINTSRGPVVNEPDLASALNSGTIAAAYLDVLGDEPMRSDTPLKNAKNCIITPHTSWAAYETRMRLIDIVCENVRAWQNGTPKNRVIV